MKIRACLIALGALFFASLCAADVAGDALTTAVEDALANYQPSDEGVIENAILNLPDTSVAINAIYEVPEWPEGDDIVPLDSEL